LRASFLTIAALLAGCSGEPGASQGVLPKTPTPLAITVDDLPAHGPLPPGVSRFDVARATIAAFKTQGVIATGFVNGSFGAGEPDSPRVLEVWKAAGLPLGNHTFTHGRIDDVGAAAFLADVDRNEPFLKGEPRYLRYPYLAEGAEPGLRDAVRAGLASRGYRIAAVTMSFDDYAYNAPYVRCLAQGDKAAVAALEERYLASARADAERARAIVRATQGRDTPQVLLLHIGAFGAHMLPRLLAQYRAEKFEFVALERAQADGFYTSTDPAQPGPSPRLDAPTGLAAITIPARPSIPGDEICPAK
jgi:peptidoglycan/xylan/chitin deacetylase (PgdA/CDA1 family)